MKTLSQWLSYIEQAHTQEIDMGLSRIKQVASKLQIDLASCVVVTVAGTNGKGSTCRFIEQTLLACDATVGVYSSPHIHQFNERIRLNGTNVSDQIICEAFNKIYTESATANNGQPISLTYFEYATLCALLIFSESELDVCLLEVGLGGRLDATNIIDADIGVITSIGLDHQDYLGDTLSEIAFEKAGIIKPKQHVVVGYDNPQSSLLNYIVETNTVFFKGVNFDIKEDSTDKSVGWVRFHDDLFEIDLSQANIPQQNIMSAIATLLFVFDKLLKRDAARFESINYIDIAQSLVPQVTMMGRFQVLQKQPYIILDVAHNQAAAELVVKQCERLDYTSCYIIVGMLKDKNITDTIKALSALKPSWLCSELPGARAAKAEIIANVAKQYTNNVRILPSIESALNLAKNEASPSDLILVVGSFIVASECLHALDKQEKGG